MEDEWGRIHVEHRIEAGIIISRGKAAMRVLKMFMQMTLRSLDHKATTTTNPIKSHTMNGMGVGPQSMSSANSSQHQIHSGFGLKGRYEQRTITAQYGPCI